MNYQPRSNRIRRSKPSVESGWRIAEPIMAIVREIYAEFQRLNRGGKYRTAGSESRREQTEAFKASLTRLYEQYNRCC